jgi:hypothetical protein
MTSQLTKLVKYPLFIFFTFAYFTSTVGNISSGISQASSDDGIISHAISFANPNLFANDVQANAFRIETPASLMNLIPAIAYKYLQIDPVFFWIFFLIVQTILYPFSVYGITSLIIHSKKQAALITLLLINFRPQTRNLSYSGDLDWMPYAMWLAQSFFVLAIYLYFKKFRNTAFILIALSGMIHPSLGLGIIFLFVIFDYLVTKDRKYLWKTPLSTLFIFFAFLFYNFKYIQKRSLISVDVEYLKSVFTNSHFNSISILTNEFDVYVITNSTIVMLVGLTLYIVFTPTKQDFILRNNFCVLLKSAYLVSIVGILTQAFGLMTENLFLVRLMGTRFTSLLAILSFILFLVLLFEDKADDNFSLFLLITFIFFPGAIVIWLFGISKAISNWSIASLNKRVLFVSLTLLSFVTSTRLIISIFKSDRTISLDSAIEVFETSHFFVRNFFFNFLSIELQFFLYIIFFVCILIIKNIWSHKCLINLVQKYSSMIILSLIFLLFIGKVNYTSDRFTPRDRYFKQIQEWARYKSTPDSLYLVLAETNYGGWRNYSRRAQITLSPSYGPYGVYKENVLTSGRIEDVVSKYPKEDLNLPTEDLLREMKLKLSVDYLVTSIDTKKYDFDIVFQNTEFIIYKI